jgi:hypothetical protein
MTLIPNPPKTVMVFKSACIPAPPPESDPAMVRTLLMPMTYLLESRLLQNATFCPIPASIPVFKIFAFLELEQN